MFENFLNVNLIILKSFINYSFDYFEKYEFTDLFALVPVHKATKTSDIDEIPAAHQDNVEVISSSCAALFFVNGTTVNLNLND
jgi:hypothetical protein